MTAVARPMQRIGPTSGDICAGLFSRSEGIGYQWAFVIPSSADAASMLFLEEGATWSYRVSPITFLASPSLIVLVKIGHLDASGMDLQSLDEAIREVSIPQSPTAGVRCEYWFRDALAELNECGFVTCVNVNVTIAELRNLAMLLDSRSVRWAHYVSASSS